MITKKYIKMCEKAEEVQEKWRVPFRNRVGDLCWRGKKYLQIPEACIIITETNFKPDNEVWLPTQEQLQEIMLKDYSIRAILGGVFYFGVKMDLDKVSMNEIWIAFVMKEKYNKIWNGDDWK